MSKLFRAASTVMVAVGLAYLFIYTQSLSVDKLTILEQPSYYAVQSIWFTFIAGIIDIVFGVLGSFFSWFKIMDPEKEALPNAGYVSDKDIHTLISGEEDGDAQAASPVPDRVAVRQTEGLDEPTEILIEPTEILPGEECSTEISDSETAIIFGEDEV